MHTISPEQRKLISESMKKAHSECRHPGWTHINSDINRRSYPEKVFLNQIKRNKITMENKNQIIKDYKDNISIRKISKNMNISRKTITKIIKDLI